MQQIAYDYLHEKFTVAVGALAASNEPIKDRLYNAYISALHHLRPQEMPPDIRDDWHKLTEQITRIQAVGDEGNLRATLNAMTDDEAVEIADQIVNIFAWRICTPK